MTPCLHRDVARIVLAATCAVVTAAFAQPRPEPFAPLPQGRAMPMLQVAGAEQPVRMTSLKVDVEVAGGAAETRIEMVFLNPNSRTLEGKLQFPLAPGRTVSGFALDVDGRLRDAVPVEKAKAQQVFEDIARRRVDPGLLQTTLGNNHELRIYPLLAGKTRTVMLKIVEPASNRLQIPLAYADRVAAFELAVRYPGATTAPEIVGAAAPARAVGRLPDLRFGADPSGGFSARASAVDLALPREPLVVRTPALAGDAVRFATEERDGERYFTLEMAAPQRRVERRLPSRVQIVWDASASASGRQLDREIALLDGYFARAGEVSVNLVRVADSATSPEHFSVLGGDWSSLRRALASTVYDGASNLGAVRHDGESAEALWFSDGLATYGAPWRLAFPVPVYAINSAGSADPAALQALADATGGRSVDLATLSRQAAAEALLTRGNELAAVTAVGAREIVSQSQSAASGRLVLAGVLSATTAQVSVQLRDGGGGVTTRTVQIDSRRNASHLAALQWARLTLASLAGEARTNKIRIADIGKRFGLATRETSLLVLEQVDDYVRNEIVPPAELRSAYDRLAAGAVKQRARSDAERLALVVRRFEARVAWWNRDFPKDAPPAPLQIARAQGAGALARLAAPAQLSRRESNGVTEPRDEARDSARTDRLRSAAAPAPSAQALQADKSMAEAAKKDGAFNRATAPAIAIALTPAAQGSASIKRLQAAPAQEWARIYFDERRANAASVGFFLDAAEFFLGKGERAFGLRALSNLAEMDLQNRQVLRLLAYRLQQAGEIDLALPIFERVLELAPNEPQSHRDLGLALAQAGRAQAAVDRLYVVVTGAWDGRFADIDLIALAELNAVVERSRQGGRSIDVAAIEPRLLRNLPLDVRVVLAWDADNTDVDLHVVDANGEEVDYGHNLSYQGGAITRDATGGYGPEEFALRIAKPGKYRVEANFFGHRQQVLTTSTGLMLWLSSGFGTPAQQDQRTTVRVKSEAGARVVVGEFEVKR